jgi:hypothetical protein
LIFDWDLHKIYKIKYFVVMICPANAKDDGPLEATVSLRLFASHREKRH